MRKKIQSGGPNFFVLAVMASAGAALYLYSRPKSALTGAPPGAKVPVKGGSNFNAGGGGSSWDDGGSAPTSDPSATDNQALDPGTSALPDPDPSLDDVSSGPSPDDGSSSLGSIHRMRGVFDGNPASRHLPGNANVQSATIADYLATSAQAHNWPNLFSGAKGISRKVRQLP